MFKKKILKKNNYFLRKGCINKKLEKNKKILNGLHSKSQTLIQWIYFKIKDEGLFFRIKKSF